MSSVTARPPVEERGRITIQINRDRCPPARSAGRSEPMSSDPNLRILKPSRKPLRPGDIFTLSPRAGTYLFGRLIATDAAASAGLVGLTLIYIYAAERSTPEPPDDHELSPARLLVPPAMINRLPWSRGYFETIDRRDLRPEHRLAAHSFRDIRGRYFDEHATEIGGPIEPVGQQGVHSFRTIDDLVSDALGIPRAPD
jgi:hypothetical protein